MKHIFSRTILLLIVFYALDRFTHYGLRGNLPLILLRDFGFDFDDMKSIGRYLDYIPLLSYLIIGFTLDKYKHLRDIRLYYIPVIVGILILFIKSPISFAVGYSLLFFISPFIKVIVLIKIFDYLKSKGINDDRAFVLMILVLNIFSFFGPFAPAYLRHGIGFESIDSFMMLFLSAWLIYGLLFFILKSEPTKISKTTGSNKQSYKILIISLLSLFLMNFFSNVIFSDYYIDSENLKPELIRSIIQVVLIFILGIVFLFLPNFRSRFKINISAFLILIIGIISLSVGFVDLSDIQSHVLIAASGLDSAFYILFSPAIYFIFLDTFNYKKRAAFLSVFYFIHFFISDISEHLRMLNQDTLISALLILLLLGFIISKLVFGKPRIYTNRYDS